MTSDAKHTPGPWCWRRFGSGPYVLATPDRGGVVILDTAVSRRGAVVSMRMGIMRNAKDRAEIMVDATPDHPDARLIAAAPDLAEALKELKADFERYAVDCPPGRTAKAKAALAKAGL